MATSFTKLPIVDLAPLASPSPSEEQLESLSSQLFTVFSTVGFAYLVNAPLSLDEDAVFGLANSFFTIPMEERMKLAKKTFRKQNSNTYRGYFPAQPGADNLKEGFEIGPFKPVPESTRPSTSPFVLTEPAIFPSHSVFTERSQTELLYSELQTLSSTLLTLLARSLGKSADFFTSLLHNSVSTLRLLHYPEQEATQELCCTPHTDSGLVTLLHQDPTGGLEVKNADGDWIPAPYVPGTIVVNIGDLMAQMSDGRFIATQHRVRATGKDRYSVPFFCEPGVEAMVGESGNEVRYEQYVLGKMGMWIEFQDTDEELDAPSAKPAVEVLVEAC